MPEALRNLFSFFPAHLQRERWTVLSSRMAWAFALVCLLWGLAGSPLVGASRPDNVIWFLLPLLLYALPVAGLLAGVVAWHGDAAEEGLLLSRSTGGLIRPASKWIVWSALLSAATLLVILPSLPGATNPGDLVRLWLYATGEIAIFVAVGIALGGLFRDAVLAHSLALLGGLLAVAAGGIAGWLGAHQPFLQQQPDLWTALLMLNPAEAARVSLVFSLEDLPFDTRKLPPLAAWWLAHTGLWYALLTVFWSLLALAVFLLPQRRPAGV